MRFDDKRVIVTGAGGGFGAAIARGFAAKGAKVMVTDIDVTAAQAVADELDGALAFGLDVTSEDAHKELADVVVEAWGGIDIVACNAGLPHRGGYMVNLTTEQFDFMWTINVRPIFFAIQVLRAPHGRWWGHRQHRVDRRSTAPQRPHAVQRVEGSGHHIDQRSGRRVGTRYSSQLCGSGVVANRF